MAKIERVASVISDASNTLATIAEQQQQAVVETTNACGELQNMVATNVRNSVQANQTATSTNQTATEGAQSMDQMLTAMSNIKNASGAVENILGSIEEIAFQTNILAI